MHQTNVATGGIWSPPAHSQECPTSNSEASLLQFSPLPSLIILSSYNASAYVCCSRWPSSALPPYPPTNPILLNSIGFMESDQILMAKSGVIQQVFNPAKKLLGWQRYALAKTDSTSVL